MSRLPFRNALDAVPLCLLLDSIMTFRTVLMVSPVNSSRTVPRVSLVKRSHTMSVALREILVSPVNRSEPGGISLGEVQFVVSLVQGSRAVRRVPSVKGSEQV